MKHRQLFLLALIVFAGGIFAPVAVMACGKSDKKAVHAKSSDTKHCNEKKNCKPVKKQQGKQQAGHKCPSNCNHSNCKCVSTCVTIVLPEAIEALSTPTNFKVAKAAPYATPDHLSQGFQTIWLIPKIS
ncbi:MAG: hypothetical protein JNJ75_17480 [Cyclobacteriaceae bacterium]|nr:hypothetical protein [Cyclobacteriaceae bacterium]